MIRPNVSEPHRRSPVPRRWLAMGAGLLGPVAVMAASLRAAAPGDAPPRDSTPPATVSASPPTAGSQKKKTTPVTVGGRTTTSAGDAPIGRPIPPAPGEPRRPGPSSDARSGWRVIPGPGPGSDPGTRAEPDLAGPTALRVMPGRHQPSIEPPGRAVAVEAVVSWSGAAAEAPSLDAVRVFVHVRPHPSLGWDTIEMRPLASAPSRFQAAIPCAPCRARPEYRLQAVVEGGARGDGGTIEGWWPPAGARDAAIYGVGFEHVLAGDAGAVLSFQRPGRGGDGRGADGTGVRHVAGGGGPAPIARADAAADWHGPTWPVHRAHDSTVSLEWRLDAEPGDAAALVVAVRPGGIGPWTIVARFEHPRRHWQTLSVPVTKHLRDPAEVQVRAWIEGDPTTVARVADVRLSEIACRPMPTPDVDGDGRVGFEDVVRVVTTIGGCPPGQDCPADVNVDGRVDLQDALEVLAAWESPAGSVTDPA